MKKRVINFSFWGVFIDLLGHALFIGGFLWIIITDEHESILYLVWKILVGILILIFIYGLLLNIMQLTTKKPAIVLGDEGITRNFAGFDSYYLRWDEIDSIEKSSWFFRKYIILKSKPGEKLIKNLPWYSRIHFYLNKRFLNEYLVIPMDELSINTAGTSSVFYELLKDYWLSSKQQ